MCYSHLDHSPNMKLHETEARARELAAGIAEDRQTLAALRQLIAKGIRTLAGLMPAGDSVSDVIRRQAAK